MASSSFIPLTAIDCTIPALLIVVRNLPRPALGIPAQSPADGDGVPNANTAGFWNLTDSAGVCGGVAAGSRRRLRRGGAPEGFAATTGRACRAPTTAIPAALVGARRRMGVATKSRELRGSYVE